MFQLRLRSGFVLLTVALLAVSLLVATGCGDSNDQKKSGTETKVETDVSSKTGCRTVNDPKPKEDKKISKPKEDLDPNKTHIAVVETSCGTFSFQLAVGRAPKTAASFAYLAKKGFYDGLTFHRIASGFVIQGGDPAGNGTGGPGYKVVEAPPKSLKYTRGVVAMAKTALEDPGTSGSQFFVVTGEDIGLPAEYALVGKVVKGQDVVDRIGVLPTTPPQDGTPNETVLIERVTIESS